MRILLVRHGESEGNVDESAYIEKGDHQVGLSPKGWKQAVRAGEFLGDFYRQTETTDWPTTFVSSYQRPKETLSSILHGIGGAIPDHPKIYEDPRLIEKFFGATNHIHHPDGIIDPEFAKQMRKLSGAVFAKDPFTARNLFGDSTKDTLIAVKSFIDGTLARDVGEGKEDFLFVVHGAVIQAFLMSWAHLPMQSKGDIKNPGNCDVISIEGQPKNWKIRKIYNGEQMKAVNEPVIKHIRPFEIGDLPPVPEKFL